LGFSTDQSLNYRWIFFKGKIGSCSGGVVIITQMVYSTAYYAKTRSEGGGDISSGGIAGYISKEKGGDIMTERDDLEKMLKRLKKDFQRNVQPVLKKHSYFISKGERTRLKKAKAIRRMRRRERQYSRAAG
jgi:ribosomal protein S21